MGKAYRRVYIQGIRHIYEGGLPSPILPSFPLPLPFLPSPPFLLLCGVPALLSFRSPEGGRRQPSQKVPDIRLVRLPAFSTASQPAPKVPAFQPSLSEACFGWVGGVGVGWGMAFSFWERK